MSSIVSMTMLAETLRIATPYACAAVGGVWAERSGVIHIGLEGVLLTSAFVSIAVANGTESAWLGLGAGVLAGVLVSAIHGWVVVRARVDAVISGIALNLVAYAATRLGLERLYGSSSNSPSIEGFRFGPVGASGLDLLGRVLCDPVTLLGAVAIALSPWMLMRTRFGLRTRAAGENPSAAAAAGLDVGRLRIAALAVSGAVCALGGVHLAFDQHRFESGMSNGRGFIALAAVALSGWRAGRAAGACLLFGALEALQIVLQGTTSRGGIGDLVQLLPYVATLVVLVVASSKPLAPGGLGRHADEA